MRTARPPPAVVLFAVLYFVWLRPAQKDRKKHQELLESLKRGDEVLTQSGVLGTVADLDDKVATLEIARNVKVRFLRSTIARKITPDGVGDDKASKGSK
jgi:preprotein translocase subunit YajC